MVKAMRAESIWKRGEVVEKRLRSTTRLHVNEADGRLTVLIATVRSLLLMNLDLKIG